MTLSRPWTLRAAGLAVSALTAALMLATEPRLAIVWDEGYTLGREARLRAWFSALKDPSRFAANWKPPLLELVQQTPNEKPPRPDQVNTRAKLLFDREVLAWFWPFAREEPHGHPPFYALVGLAGDLLAPSWPDLPRARLGPILAFSLTAGLLFVFVAARWGTWPGFLGAGAWVLQPRLFAHGHYAAYDALLSSLWVASIVAFAWAVEPSERPRRSTLARGASAFGLRSLGCAADTKLTGWLLPAPFLVWTLLYRDRRGLFTLLGGGVVALGLLYVLNPPWWGDPIGGVARFLQSNLNRAQSINIKTLFLGKVYETPKESLPWYNTLIWTVFVVPAGFLALALAGLVRSLKRWRSEPLGVLAVGHWVFLLLLRALPHTPGHDGERQFLPAFGMLALVAGLGAASAIERYGRWGKALVAAALLEGAISIALMMPVPLSYYGPLVGGLPGATRLGMEPTYYWDGLSEDALEWLNRHTPPGQKVFFATNPTSWLYLRQTGRLKPEILPYRPGTLAWYVVQNRPGAFSPRDRAIVASVRPAYVVRKWGVPLVWIFPAVALESPRPK